MQTRIKHRLETLERATSLARKHPTTLPRVAFLTDTIGTIIQELRQRVKDQDYGHLTYRSGSAIRAHHAAELRALLRSVNRIALALDPEEFPGLKQKLKMPRGDGYERLHARASAFVDATDPIRSVFVDRGLDHDFIEQIVAKQGEMVASAAIKHQGRAIQVGGTAGLAALARRGMQLLRELDAILTHQYRANADVLAAWKSAVRIQRDPQQTASLEPGAAHNGNAPSTQAEPVPGPLPSAPDVNDTRSCVPTACESQQFESLPASSSCSTPGAACASPQLPIARPHSLPTHG